MTEYVLGFLFNADRTEVLLIQKNRPDWQAGRLNGVGGHVEPGDTTPHAAMRREFEEAAGVADVAWELFYELSGDDWACDVFRAFDDRAFRAAESRTDELVSRWPLAQLPEFVLPNLRWLIPRALDPEPTIGYSTYSRTRA